MSSLNDGEFPQNAAEIAATGKKPLTGVGVSC